MEVATSAGLGAKEVVHVYAGPFARGQGPLLPLWAQQSPVAFRLFDAYARVVGWPDAALAFFPRRRSPARGWNSARHHKHHLFSDTLALSPQQRRMAWGSEERRMQAHQRCCNRHSDKSPPPELAGRHSHTVGEIVTH